MQASQAVLAQPGEETMAREDRREKAETGTASEVANLGIMRPPLVYLGAIALGLVLHVAWPVQLVPRAVSAPLGGTIVLVAVALFLSAVRTFRTAGTPVPGNRPTTTIVRTGPYRYSRNPIYLSFSLLQLGVACWVNSFWLLVTLMPAVALMSFVVIPREERYLETRFPSEYLSYKAAVRRWL
jgi:protein-S-isoprenylcysteine O-methyltransferase Ste14